MSPKIFFIGFNKCATRSFTELFRRNRLNTCHWKIPGQDQTIAEKMISNISLTKKPLDGLEKYIVFSDLTSLTGKCFIDIPLLLPFLVNEYPDSYFIYQHRSVDKWIRSRLKHAYFQKRCAQVLGGATEEEVIDCWHVQYSNYETFIRHQVRLLNFMEFELEAAPINELAHFLSKDYLIDVSFWPHKGISA